MKMFKSLANSVVLYMEGNERTWPCRCGQTHRGDYGQEDWIHCNCLHQSNLTYIFEPGEIPGDKGCQVMCVECGKVWDVEPPDTDVQVISRT